MRNPFPFLREFSAGTVRALVAAARHRDGQLVADAIRLRRVALFARLGLPVRPVAFGRCLACASPRYLAEAYEDVVLSGHYAVALEAEAPIILDCGANIGLSVLYFHHRFPKARITAFEPVPVAFEALARNTAGLPGLTLEPVAVGAHDGELELWVRADTMHAGIHRRANVHDRIAVPVRRLSQYISGPVDLLKLDVEGSELEVLHELDSARALERVASLVIEYHHHLGSSTRSRLGEFLALLEAAGFVYQLSTEESTPVMPPGTLEDIHIFATRPPGWHPSPGDEASAS